MALPDRSRRDVNYIPTLVAVSSADGETPVSLWADPTTHSLVTSGSGGSSSNASVSTTGTAVPASATYLAGSNGGTLAGVSITGGGSDGISGLNNGFVVTPYNLVYNGTTWDRQRSGGVTGMTGVVAVASPSGGATPSKLISAASNNATSLKASAGTVYHISAGNINAAARYLKLYDKASAPTVGTDVPVMTFIIPGNTAGAGTNLPIGAPGIKFSTGIAYAITTGVADSDTGAVAAAEITINLGYL